MPPQTSRSQRPVVLACTTIVYFLAAFFAATFGAVQPGSAWLTQAAYLTAGMVALYGTAKGAAVLRRDLRRRRLIRDSRPRLYDMASYLGGHPELPQPGRVLAVLTPERLVLDAGGRAVAVPLAATRQARRLDADDAAGSRAWLVARNSFAARPADAFDVEFLDGAGHPQRLTLAHFRKTNAAQWSAALAAAVSEAVTPARTAGAAPAP